MNATIHAVRETARRFLKIMAAGLGNLPLQSIRGTASVFNA